MSTFKLGKSDKIIRKVGDKSHSLIKKVKWNEFNSTILGLGDLTEESKVVSAISAIFDLEGFTSFCKQIDPQLSTPIFLSQFLNWFFEEIKEETKEAEYEEGIKYWHNLPILTKFLGDGILVIWDIAETGPISQANIIVSCKEICTKYSNKFYPRIKRKVSEAPSKLRCGIAKGNIFSVGNGDDYVGPSINFASRLQKLPGSSFAFSDRGFDVEENLSTSELKNWEVKMVTVRGIGEEELVYILKSDLKKMTTEEKKFYKDP